MPRITRDAQLRWEGNLARGDGHIAAASSGAFSDLGFSLPSRVAAAPEGKTSPEELLAAAHGGCFTMSLAGELTKAGTPPGTLDVLCTITMDEPVQGQGHQIVRSSITARGVVEGADAASFEAAARAADEGCPFSTLLRNAGADVEVTTTLDGGS